MLFMLRAWTAGAPSPSTGCRPGRDGVHQRLGHAGGQQAVDARISMNEVALLKLWRSANFTIVIATL